MSGPATEICFVGLLDVTKIDDPNSDEYGVLQTTLQTLTDQEGFQKAYYGRQKENPQTMQMCIDWDSIDSHIRFANSSAYKPFTQHLSAILLDPPRYYHVHFSHPFAHAATAAVTELVTFYFDRNPNKQHFEKNARQFCDVLQKNADGVRDVSMGWAEEEVEHKDVEGGKGRAFVCAIGWVSVEAHMAYRETQAFKDSVGLIREGPKATEMVHVAFTTHEKIGT